MRFHLGLSFRPKLSYIKWILLILGGLFAFFGVGQTKQAHALTPSNNSYYCIYYKDGTRSCDNTKTYTKSNQSYYGPQSTLNTLYDWENIQAWHTDFFNQSFCQGNTSGGLLQFRIYTSYNFVRTPVKRVAVTIGYGNQIACNTSFSINGDYTLAQCLIPQGFQNQTFTTIVVLNDDLYYADIGLSTDIGISSWNINNCNVSAADIIESNNRNTQNIIDNNNSNTNKIIENNNSNSQNIINSNEEIKNTLTDETSPTIDDNTFGDIDVGTSGAVSGLITLPLTLLTKLNNSLNDSCTPYTIPFGLTGGNETLTFPCIKPQEYLGSTIWNYIDLFVCLFMVYEIAMLIVSSFESITSLEDGFASLYTPRHARPIGKHTKEVE